MVDRGDTPRLLKFGAIGDDSQGYLSVAALARDIPFRAKRVFWTYGTPSHVIRGRHAHHQTEMVLVAVSGTIVITTETLDGSKSDFTLERATQGLYLPARCWRTMKYSRSAVQLTFASTEYSAEDYIRDHDEFIRYRDAGGPGKTTE